MPDRPKLLLTMSSSGGKWLASTVARHLPGCRYYDKEFFNPWCNPKHEVWLREAFGCEQASCYRNIARPGDKDVREVIERTWGREQYTFTKECFSAFKVELLMETFDIVGLVRSTEDVFPPRRSNVWNCYEHTWMSLVENGIPMCATRGRERAEEAHAYISNKIRRDGKRLGFPVVEFDWLQTATAEELQEELGRAFKLDSKALAAELVQTRFREA